MKVIQNSYQTITRSTIHLNKTTYFFRRKREHEFSVKSTRSPESRIDGVYSIGGSNHDDFPTVVQSIHESQQGGDNGAVDLVLST